MITKRDHTTFQGANMDPYSMIGDTLYYDGQAVPTENGFNNEEIIDEVFLDVESTLESSDIEEIDDEQTNGVNDEEFTHEVVINLLSAVESSQIQSSQIQEINERSPLTEISRETEDGDMHTTMLLSIGQLILTILGVSLLSSLYLIIEFYVISRRAERQTSLVSFRSP